MPVTVYHPLTATTPDNTSYEIRPSHWNSAHAVSLGLVGSDVIPAFSNGGNVSFGLDGGGHITGSANVTAAPSPVNVTGANGSSVNAQTIAFSNSNGMSLGVSTAAAGATITGSYTVPTVTQYFSNTATTFNGANVSGSITNNTAGLQLSLSVAPGGGGGIAAAAGTQTATSGTVVFSNSNGISFGMSNSSVVTASYTVPTQSTQPVAVSGSNGSFAFSTATFGNLNGLSFYSSNGSMVGSYTVPTVTNSSMTVSDAATSGTLARLAFTNLNGVTLSLSTGAAGSHTIVGSHNALTSQSNQAWSGSNASSAFQTLSFSNANGVSWSNNAGQVMVTHDLQYTSATSAITSNALNTSASRVINIVAATNNTGGGTASLSSNVSFSNVNGLTFYTSAGNAVVGSYTVPTVTQYFSNTGTTFNGANVSGSMTLNTNGLQLSLSAPTPGGGGAINVSAGTTSGNLQTIVFSNSNGVSFGLNGSTVTGSVAAGGGIVAGVSNLGNTAGSTGTVSTGNFVLVGSNGISLSQSTGAAGSAATVTILGNPLYTASFFEPHIFGGTTTFNPSNGTVYFQPFFLNDYNDFNRVQILQQMASQSATTMRFTASVSAGNASSGTASYVFNGTGLLFSRIATGTNASSSLIVTFRSATYSYGVGLSDSVSWSTNASSATASWTTSQAISFISSIDSVGGVTTGSSGTSGSSTFSSTSTNANSFSSTFTASFMSQHLSQVRPVFIPFGTTLSPGEYWLGIIHSTNTGSTNYSHQSVVMPSSLGFVHYTTNSSGYAEIGNSATIASSNNMWGIGSYSASSNTTAASGIPLSQISNTTGAFGNASMYFNAVGYIK